MRRLACISTEDMGSTEHSLLRAPRVLRGSTTSASGTRTLVVALLLVLAACTRQAPFVATELPDPKPAPALRLVEHGGRAFDLAAERGKVVLLFFGYTNCPDVCPTTLADWRRVRRALGADTARVRFVFVSTDPARDTPEVAQAYVRKFDAAFTGLSGPRDTVAAAERGFMVSSHAEAHDGHGGYAVAHSSRTFVVDAAGRWRLVTKPGATADDLLSDVRRLLAE